MADDPDVYVARWGLSSMVLPVVFLVAAIVVVVLDWPPRGVVWAGAAVFFVVGVVITVQHVRRLRRRDVVLAVDAHGVHLGHDDDRKPEQSVPWGSIDAVVHFTRWHRNRDHDGGGRSATRYVGILRGDEVVTERKISGWKLDLDRLAAAVDRFGGGVPVRKLPDQGATRRRWGLSIGGWRAGD